MGYAYRKDDLDTWLEGTAWNKPYWIDVHKRALELNSDGCSGVADWYIWTCHEHDIHYRTHKTLYDDSLTFDEANYILRVRIQQGSNFGVCSPMAWWRWLGVQYLPAARRAWDHI